MTTDSAILRHSMAPKPVILTYVQLPYLDLQILLGSPVFTERFKGALRLLLGTPPALHVHTGEGHEGHWEVRVDALISNVIHTVLAMGYEKLGKPFRGFRHQFVGPVSTAQDLRRSVKRALSAATDMERYGLEWPGPGRESCSKWEELAYSATTDIERGIRRLTEDLERLGFHLSRPGGLKFDEQRHSIWKALCRARRKWKIILEGIPVDMGMLDVALALEMHEKLVDIGWGSASSHSIQACCERYTSNLIDTKRLAVEAVRSISDVQRNLPMAMWYACHSCIAGFAEAFREV